MGLDDLEEEIFREFTLPLTRKKLPTADDVDIVYSEKWEMSIIDMDEILKSKSLKVKSQLRIDWELAQII